MNLEELTSEQLDKAFEKAYESVRLTDYKFKQDTLLFFYAYYKNISDDYSLNFNQQTSNGERLVNAFKMNALFQVRQLSKRDCKIRYIELASKYLGNHFLKEIT